RDFLVFIDTENQRLGSRSSRPRTIEPFPTPDGPASTISTRGRRVGPACVGSREAVEESPTLVVAQAAEPTALADVELFHEPPRAHLAHARQRLQHAHDLELAEHLVVVALLEQLLERERAALQLLLHLSPLLTGDCRLLERGAPLVGSERGRLRHRRPSTCQDGGAKPRK